MLKFLRKYDKIILAIGGTLLMIAFLVPQALQRFGGDPRTRTVATLDGQKVTEGDLMDARQELTALRQVSARLGETTLTEQLLLVEGPEHWMLLTREAERAGLVGGVQDGVNFLRTAAEILVQRQLPMMQQMGQAVTPELVQGLVNDVIGEFDRKRLELAGATGADAGVNRALAKAHGVLRMYDMYIGAGQLSDLESMALARRYFDSVKADYAVLPASRLAFQSDEPTDAEVEAHFEKYKNFHKGQGEYGFGYRREPAVSLDWIKIDRSKISGAVKVDRVDSYTHWQQNRARYPDEYSEARAAVEEELRTREVDRAMQEAVGLVQRQILNGERGLTDDGRFKALPEGWEQQKPDFQAIASSVNARLVERLGIQEPVLTALQTPLMTQSAVSQVTGLGGSSLTIGPRQINLDQLVFSVRELAPESPLALQAGVTLRSSTRDSAGNVYFVRVARAREASPPESAEMVRSDIEQDLKTLRAYERLVARADEIRAAAAEDFEKAALDNGAVPTTGVEVRRTGMLTAQRIPVTAGVNTEAARDALMDRAATLDPTIAPRRLPPLERVVAVPLPRELSLGLFLITSVEPISAEDFRGVDQTMVREAQRARAEDLARWPFDRESMMERHSFRYVRGGGGSEEDEELDAAATEEAGRTAL